MGEAFITRRGSNPLNFKLVGNPQPANPKENTIWVNTDVKITVRHFGADEPNVYDIKEKYNERWWGIPCYLSEGDIVNFITPKTIVGDLADLNIVDAGGKVYVFREYGGEALDAWYEGTPLGFRISNDRNPIGDNNGYDGTAYLSSWGSYYHEEGTVWLTTGTSSPIAFNALKKNSITVYPISAKLFSGGMWWDLEAKSYQNGAWVDWSVYLYNSGDTCSTVTGGWTEVQSSSGGTYGGRTVMNETSIYVFAESESSGCSYAKGRATANTIDLTNVSRIRAKGNCSNARSSIISAGVGIAVLSSLSLNNIVADCYVTEIGDFDITLDVSNLSGLYYVACYAKEATESGYSSIATDGEGTFSQIWYE